MNYLIKPSQLSGDIVIPPSKSHTLRAILFASLARGISTVDNYLHSPDTNAMLLACKLLGADITEEAQKLTIVGTNGKPKTPSNIIDAGNSGQVLRFVAAIAALTDGYTIITGDHSVRTNRPVQPLLDGLTGLNLFAKSSQNNAHAPIIVKGPMLGGETTLNGEDSQPVSALLIAAAFAPNSTIINVTNPGEKPWVDLTLDWLQRLNIRYSRENYIKYTIFGNASYDGFVYKVPGDFSSCAFPLVAALITNSEITLHNLDLQDAQGDKELITILQIMGAKIAVDVVKKTLHVRRSGKLVGQTINVNNYIDAVPILAVMACFALGTTTIIGASIARKKESNRLFAITQELQKMGANIIELEDGLKIIPAKLSGARVTSFNDHRIAMALTVAGMAAIGETIVENVECVDKSFPNFLQLMRDLGAQIT